MEDILASIRRILNEEEGAGPAAAPASPPALAEAPPPADDALTLSEDMMVPEPEAAPPAPSAQAGLTTAGMPSTPPPTSGPPRPGPSPRLPAAAAAPLPSEEPQTPGASGRAEGLLAPAAASAAVASVGQLLRTVAAERGAAVNRGGPTIEDVVREELRPLLKEWLDQHLPPLVERLVRAEIERLVGRAMS